MKLYWRLKKNGRWTWVAAKWDELCNMTAGDLTRYTCTKEEEE